MKSLVKKFLGFSLVEILVALIAVSCISAALAPVITKKLKSNAVTVGSLSGKMEFILDCSPWGEDCVFCTEDKCSLCSKECSDNEFVFTQDCICKNCTEVTSNCIQCSAKKCKKCQAGYGLTNINKCELCTSGSYSDGSTACLKAPKGSYVASSGASTYIPCAIGTYQDEEGKTSCKTCPAGSYQDEAGKTSCKTCEIDYMCTGGSDHQQCAADYGANAGSSSCSPCPSYCADCQVPNTCLKCNSGFYLSNNTCYPCTVGYSCDGTATQAACPAGYYAGAGASSCSACSAGTYSSGGVESCSACSSGYYSNAGASSCTSCSTTWANCTACTASGCSACESGYELNGSGGCKEGAGPPRNQADCDPYGALYYNGLCITKYNAGDSGGPSLSGAIVASTGSSCDGVYNGICCWQGNTTYKCDSINGSYSGCGRTVCQYQAAVKTCDAYSPSTKATEWRLPTYAEATAWGGEGLTVGKGNNGLQLCAYAESTTLTINRCSPRWDSCKDTPEWIEGSRYVCAPPVIWTSDYWTSVYYCGENGCGSMSGIQSTHALSVRCVTNYIKY